MADAAPAFARRAIGFAAVLFVGIALGVVVGHILPTARTAALPIPTPVTLGLAVVGIVLAALGSRAPLALRLIPALTLFGVAGATLTPAGAGAGLALAAAPLAIWSGRARSTLLLAVLGGAAAVRPELLAFRVAFDLSIPLVVVALALAGTVVAMVPTGEAGPAHARFDLRVALALAALVMTGFLLAFGATQLVSLLTSPGLVGHLGLAISAKFVVLVPPLLIGLVSSGASGKIDVGRRIVAGLAGVALVLLLIVLFPKSVGILGLFVLPAGLGLVVAPSIARAERANAILPIAALILATLLGMPLAGGLVNAFTPRLVAEGTNVAIPLATNWTLVLGFYAALALVVLLAHLAHVYEFGVAALHPDDDRDPLPILRKGLPKRKTKA